MGAPPPGPRPAPCAAAAAALFWRRFNSRPQEKLSLPGDPASRVRPEPWRGRRPRVSLPRGAIVCAARPPGRPAGPGRVRAGPGRGRCAHATPSHPPVRGPALPLRQPACQLGGSESSLPHAGAANGPRPAPAPGHAAAATLPRAIPPHPPAALRTRAAHNRFHSLGGGAGRLTRRSSRHHLRLARRGLSLPPPHPPPLYYDRRPQAGGAASRPARPAKEASRGAQAVAARRGSSPPPRPRPRARSGAKAQVGLGRRHLEGPCG